MGEQSVKNIADPVRAYRVLLVPSARKPRRSKKSLNLAGQFAVAVLAVVIGVFVAIKFFPIGGEDNGTVISSRMAAERFCWGLGIRTENPNRPTSRPSLEASR